MPGIGVHHPGTGVHLRPESVFSLGRNPHDRVYGFHALRHTAVTNVYRASRDLFLAQRFARHVSPLTTVTYTHPSDEDMQRRLRGLGC